MKLLKIALLFSLLACVIPTAILGVACFSLIGILGAMLDERT